jgi:hypothetical protein
VFRSPLAVLAWWLWVAFAVANWADLAVQGRDRFSLLVALGLLLITGVVYTVALRPRVIAGDEGLTIVNPLRDHQIGWAAVSAIEATELVRVRCEWPAGKRVIYAWAVHSSRRSEAATRMRAARRASSYRPAGGPGLRAARRSAAGLADGAPGAGAVAGETEPGGAGSFGLSADRVLRVLTQAKSGSAGSRATGSSDAGLGAQAPASRWHWPSVAAITGPAVALLIVAML